MDALIVFVFFFFQAEDGIRDIGVTGVQTCALPISGGAAALDLLLVADPLLRRRVHPGLRQPVRLADRPGRARRASHARSEERRVGEECRSRWSPDHLKKKKTTTTNDGETTIDNTNI